MEMRHQLVARQGDSINQIIEIARPSQNTLQDFVNAIGSSFNKPFQPETIATLSTVPERAVNHTHQKFVVQPKSVGCYINNILCLCSTNMSLYHDEELFETAAMASADWQYPGLSYSEKAGVGHFLISSCTSADVYHRGIYRRTLWSI
jgi:hypothetical protein